MENEYAVVIAIVLLGVALSTTSRAQMPGPGARPGGNPVTMPQPSNPSTLGTDRQQLDAGAAARAQGTVPGVIPGTLLPGTGTIPPGSATGVESGAQIGGNSGGACAGANARSSAACKSR